MFKKATRKQLRLRAAICGPTGAGKTFTALRIASALGQRIAVIDSERKSASKYVDQANPDGGVFAFDVCELESYHPDQYVKAIRAADAEGYDVLVIDSLTHAWSGKDGALEQVDKAKARSSSNGNGFAAWRDVTPMHNALVDAMLDSKAHVIATMRSKMDYILEEDSRGKKVPKKVGMAPIQRDGMEYEFDVVGDMDQDHRLVITKSRCPDVADAVIVKPGREFADSLMAWLGQGASTMELWESEGRVAFLAELAAHGVTKTYDEIVAFCASLKRPSPDKMTPDQLSKLVVFLAKEASKGAVRPSHDSSQPNATDNGGAV